MVCVVLRIIQVVVVQVEQVVEKLVLVDYMAVVLGVVKMIQIALVRSVEQEVSESFGEVVDRIRLRIRRMKVLPLPLPLTLTVRVSMRIIGLHARPRVAKVNKQKNIL
jgi:hypothetical protein